MKLEPVPSKPPRALCLEGPSAVNGALVSSERWEPGGAGTHFGSRGKPAIAVYRL